jgi:hypothetical protein
MNTIKAQEAKMMKYAKGTLLTLKGSKQNYKVVGKWHDAWVLASEDLQNTDIVMYTESEIEEGLEVGWLAITHI